MANIHEIEQAGRFLRRNAANLMFAAGVGIGVVSSVDYIGNSEYRAYEEQVGQIKDVLKKKYSVSTICSGFFTGGPIYCNTEIGGDYTPTERQEIYKTYSNELDRRMQDLSPLGIETKIRTALESLGLVLGTTVLTAPKIIMKIIEAEKKHK